MKSCKGIHPLRRTRISTQPRLLWLLRAIWFFIIFSSECFSFQCRSVNSVFKSYQHTFTTSRRPLQRIRLSAKAPPRDYYFEDEDDEDYFEPRWQESERWREEDDRVEFRRVGEADPLSYAGPGPNNNENRRRHPPRNGRLKLDETEPFNKDDDDYTHRNYRPSSYQEKEYYDDYEDDEYDDLEEEEAGNFWSNPAAGYDPVRSPNPRQRVPRPDEPPPMRSRPRPRGDGSPRGRPRRATFRSGTPPPPPVIGDFYKQLFWYGFDPDDSIAPGDKTMFGGTKGKFNGLAYLDEASTPPESSLARPSRRRRDNYYDYEDDDTNEVESFSDTLDRISRQDDFSEIVEFDDRRRRQARSRNLYEEDDLEDEDENASLESERQQKQQRQKPEQQRSQRIPAGMKQERRRRRPRRSPWEEEDDYGYDNDGRSSYYDDKVWAARQPKWDREPPSQVANWFREDDEEMFYEEGPYMDRRRRPTRSRGQGPGRPPLWIDPFEVMGSFFSFDKQNMDAKAEMYNQQMGLGPDTGSRDKRRKRRPDQERRKRFGYRYEVDESDYDSIVDADVVSDDCNDVTSSSASGNYNKDSSNPKDAHVANEETGVFDVEATIDTEEKTRKKAPRPQSSQATPTKERTWEERALAMERIPPPGVAAYGPSGDLGMDAREKVTMDALQDIQDAQFKVDERKKEEQKALDEVTILKVDMGVKKRKVAANRKEAEELRDDIFELELEIEQAARSLRKSRDKVQYAKKRLAELEDRHWAVLSLYNPEQAGAEVEDALREFAAKEPAARIQKRNEEASVTNDAPSIDDESDDGPEDTLKEDRSKEDPPADASTSTTGSAKISEESD